MTKIKAALIHLILSIIVIGVLVSVIYFIWYPQPLFDISKVIEPLTILLIVDVIIGPLLTMLVYKKNKKTLFLDLSVIVVLQIAALVYGTYSIHKGKPSHIVFHNGQFHYLMEKYSDYQSIKNKDLVPGLFSQPVYVYVSNINAADLYTSYSEFVPLDNPKLILGPHAMTANNIKAKFKSKKSEIDQLLEKHEGNDYSFFAFNKDTSVSYIMYSNEQQKIVDQLQF